VFTRPGEVFGEAATRAGSGHDERPVLRYKLLKKFIKAHEARRREAEGGPAAATDQQQAQQQQQQQAQQQQQQARQEPRDDAAGGEQGGSSGGGALAPGQLSPDEALFVRALNEDLARLNDFFVEREEDCVIKLQVGGGARARDGGRRGAAARGVVAGGWATSRARASAGPRGSACAAGI
jgi:hypothetical protein